MKILIFLLPLTGLSLLVAGFAFIWAVRSNQFDDLDSPAYRILYDEDIVPLDKDDEKEGKTVDSKEASMTDVDNLVAMESNEFSTQHNEDNEKKDTER